MAAWSLITEADGRVNTYKCTDGMNWTECPLEEYKEAILRVKVGDTVVDAPKLEIQWRDDIPGWKSPIDRLKDFVLKIKKRENNKND